MSYKKLITPLIVIIAAGFCMFWTMHTSGKVAYLNTTQLYDGFKLKKELEEKYNKVQLARQNLLDSIKFKIQYISIKGAAITEQEKMQVNDLQRSYLYKEKEFADENAATAQQYSDQIWKQINQYVDDYGKKYGYDMILGATGQGNIMFAKQEDDITKDVSDYINRRYSGAKD
jgi:outer membrane protein